MLINLDSVAELCCQMWYCYCECLVSMCSAVSTLIISKNIFDFNGTQCKFQFVYFVNMLTNKSNTSVIIGIMALAKSYQLCMGVCVCVWRGGGGGVGKDTKKHQKSFPKTSKGFHNRFLFQYFPVFWSHQGL